MGEVATQKYAVVDEGFAPNLVAVGTPVHDGDGRIIGGLSVGGPEYQVDMTRLEREFADELLNAVESLEVALS